MKILNLVKNNKLLALVAIIYLGLFITAPDYATKAMGNSMYYVKEMVSIMPVIFILTAVIEALIPKELIIKSFGDNSGLKGGVFSLLLGSISAGPIYAAFPICKMLLSKGASVGNIFIILSSWAVIKLPMLANEAKFLGAKFMGIRWILTVISIFIMAYITSKIVKKQEIPLDNSTNNNEGECLSIKTHYCVGCGLCERFSPNYFEIVDKKAKLKYIKVKEEELEEVKKVINKCPVKAINFI
ncbi:permease [Clostridium sp. UBA4548]|uniref:permease n=1 Tax=Clostridium sp. UBA4548 TaxID=1946361 RepID=UPI0025BCB312|nr:permease [Clostridium sp. UBA4548]